MDIKDRISALTGPVRDCCAAIDAGRVLATISGTPCVLYREFGDPARWHVRMVDDRVPGEWLNSGGIYEPGEMRSGIGIDPEHTPELAEARGLRPYIHLDSLRAEYRRLKKKGERQQ